MQTSRLQVQSQVQPSQGAIKGAAKHPSRFLSKQLSNTQVDRSLPGKQRVCQASRYTVSHVFREADNISTPFWIAPSAQNSYSTCLAGCLQVLLIKEQSLVKVWQNGIELVFQKNC